MAESFIEKRKRELGITPSIPITAPITSTSVTSVPIKEVSQPKVSDFVTQRKMELGIIPDTRKKEIQTRPVRPTQIDPYAVYSANKNQFSTDQLNLAPPIAPPIVPKKSAWVSPLENPIVSGAGKALQAVGTGLNTLETVTGLKNIGGAVKGLSTAELPTHKADGTYLGEYKALIQNAIQGVSNMAKSTAKGFLNPDEATQKFNEILDKGLKNTNPVTRLAAKFVAQSATDPLSYIPIPIAPLVKGLRSAKIAAETNLAGQTLKDISKAPELVKNIPSYEGIGLTSNVGGKPNIVNPIQTNPNEYINAYDKFTKEPVNLDELVKSKGFNDVTPETIAQTYNDKTWYHGSGTDKLTADMLDPNVGNHESLFGQGVYLTDNPDIAQGYANSRGRRTGTPTINYLNVNMNKVLDLEKPITPDIKEVMNKMAKPLDYSYEHHFDEPNHFTDFLNQEMSKPGATPENIIKALKTEIGDFSHEAEIPTSQFAEDFQDLAQNFKEAGYDALTHTGGLRTGKDPHRVMIMLDPQNWHGSTAGQGSQVTRMGKFETISKIKPSKTIVPPSLKPLEVKPPEIIKPIETIPAIEAQAKSQSFFTQLFGEQNIGFTPFSSTKSGRMVSTEQQIVSKPLISSAKGLVESGKQTGRAIYQNTTDYLQPLKKISPETYNTAMDSSRANNIANTIIKDKFVDNEGNVIGGSLNDIMKTAQGLGKKLDDYLILRHSVDRMNRGEKVYDPALNMTSEKAVERVKILEQRYPQLKQAGKEWNKFNGNLLDSGVKEGLLTTEARDAMQSQSPNYASMRRQFTTGEKLAQPKFTGGTAFSGQKAPIKSVSPTGSIRKIVSPIRSSVEQVQAWKQAELRNRTMQSITKAIQSDPEGMKHIGEIVKKPSTSYKSLDNALREGGSDEFLQQLDGDFKSLFKPAKTGEENIVRAMVNGNPIFIKVHDAEAVKALLGMGSDQSGYILDAMQKLSNATKRGATGILAPMFAVKSLSADVVQAAIQSPNAFKHIAVDLPHALISSIADTLKIPGLNKLAEDFRRSGGEYSALLRGERSLKKSMFELRKEAPLSMGGLVKGTVTAVKAPFKALEKVADISENANRMAAFRRAMVGKERTPENVRNAINAARESTTNYSRKGAFAKETEAFVPYSNAAIQGMYRISKAFYHNPIKTLAGVGTLIVAPKLMEYAKFHNDPDYHNIPARERYRNIILSKNADGTFRKQFMPPEYEAIGAFMTDVLSSVIDKNPQAYKGTLDALVNAWTPPIVSGAAQGITQGGGIEQSLAGTANATVAAPIVSTLANKSFTGAPIEPASVTDRSPKYRYDEKTSGIAKKIGEITGFSPMKTDYIMRAYGGDPARLLLPLTSDVGAGNIKNTLLKNFIVDPTFTNNLTNDFYGAKQRLSQAYRDNKEVNAPLPTWYDEGLRNEVNSTAAGSISKRLSILSGDKKNVTTNKSLNTSQKTQQLREIQAKINKIYVDINSRLDKQKVPFK